MVLDLGDEPHVQFVHMVAHCSPLTKYATVIASLLDSYEGEKLGKKAPGGLSRKSRGKNN